VGDSFWQLTENILSICHQRVFDFADSEATVFGLMTWAF
jgi:hypothetical protein